MGIAGGSMPPATAGGGREAHIRVIVCIHVWKGEARYFKLKWQIVEEQPRSEPVPGLQDSNLVGLRRSASCEVALLGDWVEPGSWGAALAVFGCGV